MSVCLMTGFQIIIDSGQSFDADLAQIQKYSEYYRRGFNGNFSERNESHLTTHATEATVSKFLGIIAYLTALDEHDGDVDEKFPLNWNYEETWELLFELWHLSDYLMAPQVNAFIETYIEDKARAQTTNKESALSPAVFNQFWDGLDAQCHHALRKAMIVAISLGPSFNSDFETRDQLLEELPMDAQRAIVHELHRATLSFRDKAEKVLAEFVEKDTESVGWGSPWSIWSWSEQTQTALDSIRALLGFGTLATKEEIERQEA